MFGWFARLVRTAAREKPAGTGGARAAGEHASRADPAAPEAADLPGADDDRPFAPFARALGLDVPPPPPDPDTLEPDEGDLVLADRVLEHFRRNRPGPASAPSLSLRVLNLVASPDADVGEMVRLVSADPALSAGVLTVANSVHHRGLEEIETVRAAVVRLGLEEVARVAGALSAKSLFNPRLKAELAAYAPRFGALYHRALTAANGAAFAAMQLRGGRADRAFLGGLLFDVGRSIALRSVAALSLAEPGLAPDEARLGRVLDRVHVEIGAECHQEWQLPQYLTVIAVRHHDREVPAEPEFVDLHAVRLTGALLDLRGEDTSRAALEVVQSAAALGLSPLAVRSLDAELREAAQRVASAFGLEARKG
jgi:HD-like signal output (HDOD) protein